MANITTRMEDVQEWTGEVMEDYVERWRQSVADEVTEQVIATIPEQERTETLVQAVTDTALMTLGLKPLPQAEQGEQ